MMVMINPGRSGCSLLSSSALRVPALFRSCLYFLWLTSWFFLAPLDTSLIFGTKVKFNESFFSSFWHLPIGTHWYNYWRCILATWFNIFGMCQSKDQNIATTRFAEAACSQVNNGQILKDNRIWTQGSLLFAKIEFFKRSCLGFWVFHKNVIWFFKHNSS